MNTWKQTPLSQGISRKKLSPVIGSTAPIKVLESVIDVAIGLTPGYAETRQAKDRILTHLGKKVGRFEKMMCAATLSTVVAKLAANASHAFWLFFS